ncbi:discoidin domain-containing protein [Actinopolymorpha sp. B9G3]|uniref:discoidin domain-containing protein n=1 Tax=Actinopolymorpha sp. B9G3 TaxID=3158970 RepID=UPI0032D8B6C9
MHRRRGPVVLLVAVLLAVVCPTTATGMRIPGRVGAASSVAPNSDPARITDGDIFTHYTSAAHDSPHAHEWVAVDMGQVRHHVNRVRLYPREGSHGFPERFAIEVSADGEHWRDVSDSRVSRAEPGGWGQVIVDFRGTSARYVRLNASRLGRDDEGRYSLQLAELTVEALDAERPDRRASVEDVEVSTEAPGHLARVLIDGGGSDYWSSTPTADPTTTESVTVRFAKLHDISALSLLPASGGRGFPIDFRLQYSTDGTTFTDIAGQAHLGHEPKPGVQTFRFEPVRAAALRVVATRLDQIADGVHAFRLAEIGAEVGAPFRTNLPGDFDRRWNEMWLQYGAVADGQDSVYQFGNEPNYFEWMARKILWSREAGYREALKDRVREHPQNPQGYVWSWGDNPRWPSGNALHQTTSPMYILAAWRIAVWDDPDFLADVDTTKAADVPTIVGYEATKTTPAVPDGGSLGQSFAVEEEWTAVGGRFPTFGAQGSAMTLSVYRGGPGGELVGTRRFDSVPDASWQYVTFDAPQPPGEYYLEMTDPDGPIHWWSTDEDVEVGWQAFTDGHPTEGDRSLRVQLARQDTFNTDASKGRTVWEKIVESWRYLEGHGAKSGILVIDNDENDGTPAGEPSNYWDNLKMGYKEPYTNLYFYAATQAMSDLYRLRGNDAEADRLAELAAVVRREYRQTFWSEEKGRFVSTVDIDGTVWDFGLTFLNLEAIAYGLASQRQAERILSWLDGDRTISGERSTGADIYHFTFAPRANTVPIESAGKPYWWNDVGGAISLDAAAAWDEHLENGGAIFYTSFYDILARHRTRGVDDAFARMLAIADEYAVDEIERRPRNSYGADWRLGTTGPFPESGLVPASMIYTVFGADASAAGLRLAPKLPRQMSRATVEDFTFRGRSYDITVDRNGVRLDTSEPGRSTLSLEVEGLRPGRRYQATVSAPSGGPRAQEQVTADASGAVRLRVSIDGPTRLIVR